ncbi:MAG: hypothetical protein AAF628_32015 [Planctomycetota bacterium]
MSWVSGTDASPHARITRTINAALAFVLFFVAKEALGRRGTEDAWPEPKVDTGLRWALAARRVMTTYSIVVVLMITVKQGFPPLGPWLPV